MGDAPKALHHGLTHLEKFLSSPGMATREAVSRALVGQSVLQRRIFAMSLIPTSGTPYSFEAKLDEDRGTRPAWQGLRMVSLRRWGSDSSLHGWAQADQGNFGGGHVVRAGRRRAVVIDPGLDFLSLFYSHTPFRFTDISAYLVTHNHIDHGGDLDRLLHVGHKYHTEERTLGYNVPFGISIFAARTADGPIRRLTWEKDDCTRRGTPPLACRSLDPGRQAICETSEHCALQATSAHVRSVTTFSRDELGRFAPPQAELADWLTIKPLAAGHLIHPLRSSAASDDLINRGTPQSPTDYSAGFDVTVVNEHERHNPYRLLVTGDSTLDVDAGDKAAFDALVGDVEERPVHMLLANLGSLKLEELHVGLRPRDRHHLGITKLVAIARRCRPKVLVVTEILREQSYFDYRLQLKQLLEQLLEGSGVESVLISEIGLTLVFHEGEVRVECACCAIGGEPRPARDVFQVKADRFDKTGRLDVRCRVCDGLLTT